MHLRVFRVVNVLLIAAFVACSSTRAGADGHMDANTNVHPSRRLPVSIGGHTFPFFGSKAAKSPSSEQAANILRSADDNAGAAAKTTKTADDAAGNAANTRTLSEKEIEKLAKQISKLSPEKRSKLKTVGLWAGEFLIVVVLIVLIHAMFKKSD